MRNIARIFLWLTVGVLGSALIVVASIALMNFYSPAARLPTGPQVNVNVWDRGYVSATGTWIMENDRPAFPVQLSKIQCYRDEKYCTAAQAEIGYANILNLETYHYTVTKWDNSTILFTTDALCVEYTYTIDRANMRLVGTRTKKPDPAGDCALVENKPLQLTLSDGFAVSSRLEAEASSRVFPFMWVALGMWWLFVGFKAWPRKASPARTH